MSSEFVNKKNPLNWPVVQHKYVFLACKEIFKTGKIEKFVFDPFPNCVQFSNKDQCDGKGLICRHSIID